MFRESRLIGVYASDFLVPGYGQRPRPVQNTLSTVARPIAQAVPVARPMTAVKPTRVVVPDTSGVGFKTVTGSAFAASQQDVRRQEALQPLMNVGKAAGPRQMTAVPSPGTPAAPLGYSGLSPSQQRQAAVRRTAEEKATALFNLSRRSESDKLNEIGIDQNRAKLFDWMKNTTDQIGLTQEGRFFVSEATPETLKTLQGLGAVDTVTPIGSNFKILFRLSQEDYLDQFPKYDYIKTGEDVRQMIKDYQAYERQSTADLAQQGTEEPQGRKFAQAGQLPTGGVQNDGRSSAVRNLVSQGVTDPNQIAQYMNYDQQGNQIGDMTPEEAQQIMQQRPQTNLPPYSADPLAFIDSYGSSFKSLANAGYQREDALDYLKQDEEDSRFMYSQGLEDAKSRREAQIKFDEELGDLERNREITAHEKELAVTTLDNARAEVVARDQAEQDEEVSRRIAARLGITQGGAGVKWLRDIVRKSSEHLSYIIQRGGLEEASLVRQHANNMADIDHNAQARYDKAWDNYTTSKSAVTGQRLLDKKTTRSERARIDKEYNDRLFEIDKWKGENYLKELQRSEDKAFETYKLDRQEKIEGAKTRVQTATDKIKFARDTSNLISNNNAYKEFDEVRTRTKNSEEALASYKAGYIDRSVMSNILVKNFEKTLDPPSIVREGEFKMTESLQPYFATPKGWEGLMMKLTQGGIGIPEKVFDDLVTFGQAATRVQQKRAQQAVAPLLWQVQQYNEVSPDNPITPQMALPEGLPVGDWNAYGNWAGEYHAQGGDAPSFDYTKEDTAPPVNSHVQTTIAAGVITNYGSAVSMNGLDIAAQAGTAVRSPMGGTIEEVTFNPTWRGNPFSDSKDFQKSKRAQSEKYKAQKAQNGGWGNSVVVKLDNGFKVRVSHLSYTIAQEMEGQRIEYGSELGRIGNTGMTYGKTGSHVDIEMFDDKGKRLNPRQIAAFIGAGSGTPQRDPANDYIPVAYASDVIAEETPSETPNVPIEQPPEEPVSRAGQTLSVGTPMIKSTALVEKPVGAFRNVKTGELSYPTQRQLAFYQQSPHIYEDLTKPRDTTPAKPAPKIAGGKTINLLSKKK